MLILLIGFEKTGPSIYTIFQKQYNLLGINSNFISKLYIYIYIYIYKYIYKYSVST